jgi:hypothetical protein
MRFIRATSIAALFLLFATIVPVYAQHEKENEKQAKPEKQAAQTQQPKQEHAQQAKQQQPKQEHAQQTKQQQPKQERVQQTKQQQPKQERAQQAKQQQPKQERAQQAKQQQPKQQQQAQRSQQARQQQQPQRTRQQAVAWQQQRGWTQGGGWQSHSTWQQDRSQHWDSDHRTWAQRGGYGGYYIPEAQFDLDFGIGHGFRMHGFPSIYMGYPRFAYGGFSFLLVDPYPESWAANWYDTDDLYIGYDNGYYLYDRRYPNMGLAITVAL